jgi:chemotaxis protein MotA
MATRKGMDPSILLGIGIGFGGIFIGFLLERGNPLSLVGLSALIIIVGGIMGAITASFSLKETLGMIDGFKLAMETPRVPDKGLLEMLLSMSDKSRKDGLLSLEGDIEDMDDPYLKKGLRLVVDGTDSAAIVTIMETEIDVYENKMKRKAAIFDAAGGFSPTMGIIGTVCALVIVLAHLGGEMNELGHSISTAFIATLYGISFANLIFLPTGYKLKNNMKAEVEYRMMLLAVILSLQNGDSTAMFKVKVGAYFDGVDLEGGYE